MLLDVYEGINQFQRINHFPSSFEATRKDKLCENIVKMQLKYGKAQFNIVPDTYLLPEEFNEFYSHFMEQKAQGIAPLWIVKPNAMSRGRGIYIIDDLEDVPVDESCIISQYIPNPLLINGLKFDLRIYVTVTCVDPLRIYIYNEGLTRFASEKYKLSDCKSNRFAHLTNYSVNKKNEKFVQNTNSSEDGKGSKWSLSALFRHLAAIGVDCELLWSRIYDIIIKSLISVESQLNSAFKKHSLHRNNCFELFGYDILIDSELRPWLMEINLTPSLACESPLDLQIKSNLIADLFTMVGMISIIVQIYGKNIDEKKYLNYLELDFVIYSKILLQLES